MENYKEGIISVIEYLDKVNEYLQAYGLNSREYGLARDKLEEAVFWLTYGMENENDNEGWNN